jgi:hypothetical protein
MFFKTGLDRATGLINVQFAMRTGNLKNINVQFVIRTGNLKNINVQFAIKTEKLKNMLTMEQLYRL